MQWRSWNRCKKKKPNAILTVTPSNEVLSRASMNNLSQFLFLKKILFFSFNFFHSTFFCIRNWQKSCLWHSAESLNVRSLICNPWKLFWVRNIFLIRGAPIPIWSFADEKWLRTTTQAKWFCDNRTKLFWLVMWTLLSHLCLRWQLSEWQKITCWSGIKCAFYENCVKNNLIQMTLL